MPTKEVVDAYKKTYGKLDVDHNLVKILLDAFNEAQGLTMYTMSDLSCRDCMNNMYRYWKFKIYG